MLKNIWLSWRKQNGYGHTARLHSSSTRTWWTYTAHSPDHLWVRGVNLPKKTGKSQAFVIGTHHLFTEIWLVPGVPMVYPYLCWNFRNDNPYFQKKQHLFLVKTRSSCERICYRKTIQIVKLEVCSSMGVMDARYCTGFTDNMLLPSRPTLRVISRFPPNLYRFFK